MSDHQDDEEGGQAPATNGLGSAGQQAQEGPVASAGPRRSSARLVVGLLVVFAAAALLRAFVYESDIVEGNSMSPALESGDFILISKLGRGRRPPQRFDVVTFRAPDGRDVLIKRVIGLPGEWVWVWGDQVFINGGTVQEPYVARWRGTYDAPTYVPRGSVSVLGDNRDSSEDSRVWGPIPLSAVRGRAVLVYFPLARAGLIR